MLSDLLDQIEKYDSIAIFRHVFPDMDALGSQFGLASWIRWQFPEKKVYCLGKTSPLSDKLGLMMNKVLDDELKKSLGIVLDTSNAARIDDSRYVLCHETYRVDHHVPIETICTNEYIDEEASATCELLGLFFESNYISINKEAAQLLYNGLTADNIRFSISTVRSRTYDAAKYLFEMGADVLETERVNFSTSLKEYQYETKVRMHSKVSQNFLYAIMEEEEYLDCGLSFTIAKEKVHVLAGIEEISIWALFTRMEDHEHYSASLRSKTISVREVAQEFGGGGHVCACGIKNLTIDQVHEIIYILSKRS